MSHHFTAEFTVLPPGKDPVSKKLQSEKSSSAKKRESDRLDFDNKQMAWKLNQIKQAMAKEKEDRGKQGYIWKSGKTGNLDSYARNILGRSVSATNNGNLSGHKKSPPALTSAQNSKTRIKVLKNEPIDLPKRDSAAKDLLQKLKSGFQADSMDTETTNGPSSSVAETCEKWILVATDRSSNDIMELQSDENGNLPLSSIRAMDPTAVGVYFVKWGRKRLMMAVDNVIRKPKVGWGNEVYYPYAGRFLPEMTLKPEPPLRNSTKAVLSPHDTPPANNGGALLKGSFNEEENSKLFQQAVNDWRNKKHENRVPTPPSNEKQKMPDISVHVVQCNPPEFKVKFSETSTLSYMERILLDRHRNSEVPAMPGRNFVEQLNSYLDSNSKESEENVFSAEELEERERIRQLFMPQLIHAKEIDEDWKVEDNLCNTILIEEVPDNEYASGTEACVVEESPPSSPDALHQDFSSVVIEEMDYTGGMKAHFTSNAEILNELATNQGGSPHVKSPLNGQLLGKQQQVVRHGSKSAASFSSASRSPRDVGRSKSAEIKMKIPKKEESIATKPSSLIKVIGEIPLNPDAIYRRGLKDFFVSENSTTPKLQEVPSGADPLITSSTIATGSTSWNRTASICSPDMLGAGDTIGSNSQDFMNVGIYSPMLGDSDFNHEEEEKEQEEKTLDDLEWELASRTGNITADGRISRIIDEWPEGELDIIDDPGLGSGLSTPDVDRVSLAGTFPTSSSKGQMNLDFQSMEQLIMADLTDEYSEEDDELLFASR